MAELINLPEVDLGAVSDRFASLIRLLEPFLSTPDDFCVAGGCATALACDIYKLLPTTFGDVDIFVRSKKGEWTVGTWLIANVHMIFSVYGHDNVLIKILLLQFICSDLAKRSPTFDGIVLGFDLDYCCVAIRQARGKLLIGMGPSTMLALVTRVTHVSPGFSGPLRPSRVAKAKTKGFEVECAGTPMEETGDAMSPYAHRIGDHRCAYRSAAPTDAFRLALLSAWSQTVTFESDTK